MLDSVGPALGLFGFFSVRWVHSGDFWGSLGSLGIVVFLSFAAWGSSGSFWFVGFMRARAGGRSGAPWASFRHALGVYLG